MCYACSLCLLYRTVGIFQQATTTGPMPLTGVSLVTVSAAPIAAGHDAPARARTIFGPVAGAEGTAMINAVVRP